jgi:excinuclease ABC subunit B
VSNPNREYYMCREVTNHPYCVILSNAMQLTLRSNYQPGGDQPEAIDQLVDGLSRGLNKQTLLGVTGSGKTFTIANVINRVQTPTLVIAHNKTLAAQLCQEFRDFFPDNAVHYFVSYYDYYQPEAYIANTDTFIEKDAQINKEIDRLRHSCTQALLTRSDVIIIASVSCIYGLGSPEEYKSMHQTFSVGDTETKRGIMEKLVSRQYSRTTADLTPATFRSIGNTVEIMPVQEQVIIRIDVLGSRIARITRINHMTSVIEESLDTVMIFPAKHFVASADVRERVLVDIKAELDERLAVFQREGKLLEYERLKRRTNYDIAMIREVGYCSGIENYSRHFSGKNPGEAPDTLIDYFPRNTDGTPAFLTVIDESHVTVPQIGGMYAGDKSRKDNLVEFGFRLPSALDNRPLRDTEFWQRVGQTIYVSATPGKIERSNSEQVVEQIIRPTGLIDPEIGVRPVTSGKVVSTLTPTLSQGEREQEDDYPGQVHDFVATALTAIQAGGRVLATTLTKQMAEDLSIYLKDKGIRAAYLHSDVETLDRIKILTSLRKKEYDCLVGVNLLREGLDLPEVTLVGILDADKQGFLRSETALIQTIGRAARNSNGKVLLYADTMTDNIVSAIRETNRRREIQVAHNTKHGITPTTIIKETKDITELLQSDHAKSVNSQLQQDLAIYDGDKDALIKAKRKEMEIAASEMDYETAAIIRDEIGFLEGRLKEVVSKIGTSNKRSKHTKN